MNNFNKLNKNLILRVLILITLFSFFSCSAPKKKFSVFDDYLHTLDNNNLKKVLLDKSKYEVQIYYTSINKKNNSTFFNSHVYGLNENNYFYPASTVKLLIAILALEKVDNLDNISIYSKYKIQNDNQIHTIAEDISLIFSISDNEAFNRLFDFLGGQEAINSRLQSLKIDAKINHRLSTNNASSLQTKEIIFENDIVFPSVVSPPLKMLHLDHLKKGKGFYLNDSLVNKPMDFSLKNYYSIQAMNKTLKLLFYPNSFSDYQRFKLKDETLNFLKQAMKMVPKEVGYDRKLFKDSYVKYFLYGDKDTQIPEHIEIYNKVGQAYGTLTDNAYIVDKKNNICFFLTATLIVNENQIFNDDQYEYESIGIPFLAELGRAIYQYELKLK